MRQGARKEASYLVITIILINEKKRRHTCRCPRDTEPFVLESRLTQKNILRSLSKKNSQKLITKKQSSEILRIHCPLVDYVYLIWSRIC
jgi:hypothetical protein